MQRGSARGQCNEQCKGQFQGQCQGQCQGYCKGAAQGAWRSTELPVSESSFLISCAASDTRSSSLIGLPLNRKQVWSAVCLCAVVLAGDSLCVTHQGAHTGVLCCCCDDAYVWWRVGVTGMLSRQLTPAGRRRRPTRPGFRSPSSRGTGCHPARPGVSVHHCWNSYSAVRATRFEQCSFKLRKATSTHPQNETRTARAIHGAPCQARRIWPPRQSCLADRRMPCCG